MKQRRGNTNHAVPMSVPPCLLRGSGRRKGVQMILQNKKQMCKPTRKEV